MIAETTDLPTKMVLIVVTDDQGRYVIPDLPKAEYKLWVRGYGLVDSKPVQSSPGRQLDISAVIAPDARAVAQYYPANYWLSLLEAPKQEEFPGTGPEGNGIPPESPPADFRFVYISAPNRLPPLRQTVTHQRWPFNGRMV